MVPVWCETTTTTVHDDDDDDDQFSLFLTQFKALYFLRQTLHVGSSSMRWDKIEVHPSHPSPAAVSDRGTYFCGERGERPSVAIRPRRRRPYHGTVFRKGGQRGSRSNLDRGFQSLCTCLCRSDTDRQDHHSLKKP